MPEKLKKPLKIGLLGLGTVGQGLLQILRKTNLPLEVVAIVDRSFVKKKEIIQEIAASDDISLILENDEIDVVVELTGGVDFALQVIQTALQKNKHVVTANKFLIAEHGFHLFQMAYEKRLSIGFEAAVAGAIPIVRTLSEIFSHEKITKLEGILNGTSNYILTVMRRERKTYQEVLKKAQELGLAEADPSLDINGMDAVHKLSILSSIILGSWNDYHNIEVIGIENIRLPDIKWAEKMNYRIRLLATLEQTGETIFAEVEPVMIPAHHFLWDVEMENNAIYFEGEYSGPHVFMGKGAGMLPTAYSVFSDIVSLLSDSKKPFQIKQVNRSLFSQTKPMRFYVRLEVKDYPGVLSKISQIFATQEISIATVHQDAFAEEKDSFVDLILLTHYTSKQALATAMQEIKNLEICGENLISLPLYN